MHVQTDTGNLTPAGKRKEWNCSDEIPDEEKPLGGCRPNNVPICPIASTNNNVYVTLGGGGLFVAKLGKSLSSFSTALLSIPLIAKILAQYSCSDELNEVVTDI